MSFILSLKQVTANIVKINVGALRTAIQLAASQTIGHAMEHGTSPLAELLMQRLEGAAMTKKMIPELASFLVKHGPFVCTTGVWQFSKVKAAAIKEGGYDYDEYVAALPAWDEKPDAAKKSDVLDLMKELESLILRADKKSVDGKCTNVDLILLLKAAKARCVSDTFIANEMAKAKEAGTTTAGMERSALSEALEMLDNTNASKVASAAKEKELVTH